ncbi:glycine cleavage system aminomethyltransferase GcvT [Roseovarius indicus]|uniref:aminomethyltransferase n=1 Tax=Roseovarius indicus TaxID=540747 RepID=A0A0T5P496_9RHOB|nr:glycine cleavage system aminomethyltransferase GcvT [Roseovarius indicus]KRS15960.1 glycine cleavage system protein T [Roseovarius indicus]QEW27960.1 Aminomethyltransferase [Roseovarius indicus]SFE58572.1 aminomethyltransferase [Roseovarius indicus]
MSDLGKTPLYDLHVELGAKMVPFAGYEMPVQYKLGVMKEHLHTREKAGLFDVSHMGQVILRHEGGYGPVAQAMEGLVPVSLLPLGEKRQRYGFFTNDDGGILDDLMMTNRGDHMLVVVNAACKEADIAHMKAGLDGVEVAEQRDRALLALQGPAAEEVLEPVAPGCDIMKFMDTGIFNSDFGELWVSRSGYTGEDGYEISVHATHAEALARHLLAHDAVEPIGLGARDSLRLEGGLCLYGHDIDEATSPVEGNLAWAIQKVRRSGGDRAGGFPGAERILNELDEGTPRLRVGLAPEGRAPMREGVQLFADEEGGEPVGHVTSGAFGPTVGAPVSMGYVPAELSRPGARLFGEVRGKRLPVRVAELPFVPANFKR